MWLYIPSACVPVGPGSKLDSTLPVPELSHLSFTWNDRPMRRQSWPRVWKKEPCIRRLSGLTLKPCAAQSSAITFAKQLAAKALAASRQDIPANPFPSPVSSVARMIRDTYGQRSVTRLSAISRACVFSRTSQATLLSDSIPFSLIYERWATELRAACLLRRRSVLLTSGSGCSSWPTACTSSEQRDRCSSPPHGMANTDKTGKKGGAGGGEFALQANSWPTPNQTDNKGVSQPVGRRPECDDDLPSRVERWPTPASRDHKSGQASQATLDKNARPLNEAAEMNFPSSPPAPATEPLGQESSQGGQGSHRLWLTPKAAELWGEKYKPETSQRHAAEGRQITLSQQVGHVLYKGKKRLNPNFVDWLMGYPIGHSDCDSTVTPSYLSRWRRLSSLCLRHWLAKVTE